MQQTQRVQGQPRAKVQLLEVSKTNQKANVKLSHYINDILLVGTKNSYVSDVNKPSDINGTALI